MGRAHGLRGEVAVTLLSTREDRLATGARVHAGDRELVVEESRPHAGRWLVRFAGVVDRTAAEALRGAVLTAEPVADAGDDSEQLWVHDVVGAGVRDTEGRALGRITAVEANPAHDLLVLDDGGLIPAVFVIDRDPDGTVVVDLPPGLLDVNS